MPLNFPALDNSTLSPKANNSFKSRLMAITLCLLGLALSNLKPLAVIKAYYRFELYLHYKYLMKLNSLTLKQ